METTQYSVKKKMALVTGASRGFGYQLAKQLSSKNFHVFALSRTVGALEELSDEIVGSGGSVTLVPIDLTISKDIERLGVILYQACDKLDLFVHAAAMPASLSPVNTSDEKIFEKLIRINATTVLSLIKCLDPLLKKSNNPLLVFIDDESKTKFKSLYSSSKAAAREIIKAYSEENKRLGPRVMIHSPKPMPTALRAKFHPGESHQKLSTCIREAEKLVEKIVNEFF